MPRKAAEEIRWCLRNGRAQQAAAMAADYPSSSARDLLLAQAWNKTGCRKLAYDLLLRRFLLGDIQRCRTDLVKVLLEAASGVDPAMECVMKGSSAARVNESAKEVLRRFYFGGIRQRGSSSPFEKVRLALQEIRGRASRAERVTDEEYFIRFLKTYASYTPLLPGRRTLGLGGGYFAAFGGYGCVIDPGHHFLDNFLRAGYSLGDVHCIIVTHFHDDHYADLPALLSLVYQQGRGGEGMCSTTTTGPALFLDQETHDRFRPLLEGNPALGKCTVLRPAAGQKLALTNNVTLVPLPTRHQVHGRHTGVGLALRIRPPGSAKEITLVITGDTGWDDTQVGPALRVFRDSSPILVAHVSTAPPQEAVAALTGIGEAFYGNHLGIHGLCRAIEETKPSVVILSEVGEELKDCVASLSEIIWKVYDIPCKVGNDGYRHDLISTPRAT